MPKTMSVGSKIEGRPPKTIIAAVSFVVAAACGSPPADPEPSCRPALVEDLGQVTQAVGGGFHSLALIGESPGGLYGWGHNVNGQVGLGTDGLADALTAPRSIPGNESWRSISAGALHTLALDGEGRLWAWGYGESGQLGLGESGADADRHEPTRVGGDAEWLVASAGGEHSLLVGADGTLWAFGYNSSGQLGLGTGDGLVTVPRQVGEDSDWLTVSAGAHHSLALKEDGSLFAWGSNRYGQLGLGRPRDPGEISPVRVGAAEWESVSAGGDHSLGVRRDGSLWSWGRSEHGQTGVIASEEDSVLAPRNVDVRDDWLQVSAGYFHSLARRRDGSLWAFGDNEFGQLGAGTCGGAERSAEPLRVEGTGSWDSFSAGYFHSLAVQAEELFSFGRNEFGQLGTGN